MVQIIAWCIFFREPILVYCQKHPGQYIWMEFYLKINVFIRANASETSSSWLCPIRFWISRLRWIVVIFLSPRVTFTTRRDKLNQFMRYLILLLSVKQTDCWSFVATVQDAVWRIHLLYRDRDKMFTILHMTLSNSLTCMKMFIFWLTFYILSDCYTNINSAYCIR